MLAKILDKIKNRSFWAGVATAVAGILAGTVSCTDAVISLLTNLLGG